MRSALLHGGIVLELDGLLERCGGEEAARRGLPQPNPGRVHQARLERDPAQD